MNQPKISVNTKYHLLFFFFSFLSVFFIELSYFQFNFISTFNWIISDLCLLAISIIIIMSFMIFLFAIFRHLTVAIYIPVLISLFYSVGLYFKLLYRGMPVLPYEISLIFDFKELLSFLNDKQKSIIYIIITLSIILLIVLFKFDKRKEQSKDFRFKNIVVSSYIIFMLINYNLVNPYFFFVFNTLFCAFITYSIYKSKSKIQYKISFYLLISVVLLPNFKTNSVKKLISYSAVYPNGDFKFVNYKLDGVIPAFLSYSNVDYIEKPYNYSKEAVENIVNKYKEIAKTQNLNKTDISSINPNIIYVMSESFSDPRNVENISINENPLENFDGLRKKYTSGAAIAQNIGGGTNVSEFEALTGVSSTFLNNTMFFNNIAKRTEFPSIVSMLEAEGYRSAAIHFYSQLFYNRTIGYGNLGIDHFYNETELEKEFYDNNKVYSNDESNYKQILKLLKEYDEPAFIHNVTIQNHGPYTFELSDNQYTVEGLFNSEKKGEAETYLKELEHSDKELEKFLNNLDEFEEPTIVVFWGDHLPYFYSDEDFGDDIMDKYQTPLLVYSNFREKTIEDIGTISMNYIPNNLFNIFEFKASAYYYLLQNLQECSNVLNGVYNEENPANFYAQYKKGKELEAETVEIFKDYEMILYDIFVGENYSVDLNFFEIEN